MKKLVSISCRSSIKFKILRDSPKITVTVRNFSSERAVLKTWVHFYSKKVVFKRAKFEVLKFALEIKDASSEN